MHWRRGTDTTLQSAGLSGWINRLREIRPTANGKMTMLPRLSYLCRLLFSFSDGCWVVSYWPALFCTILISRFFLFTNSFDETWSNANLKFAVCRKLDFKSLYYQHAYSRCRSLLFPIVLVWRICLWSSSVCLIKYVVLLGEIRCLSLLGLQD